MKTIDKQDKPQSRAFIMKPMEHYSGFSMPAKNFANTFGAAVTNGWIITGKQIKPWYLDASLELSEGQKLQNEAFLFHNRVKMTVEISHPILMEPHMSERNAKDVEIICSAYNACQLAFHNIAISVLKNTKSSNESLDGSEEKKQLDYNIQKHIRLRNMVPLPSKGSIEEVVKYFKRLPIENDSCK